MAELRPFLGLADDDAHLESLSVLSTAASGASSPSQIVEDWTVGAPVRVRGEIGLGRPMAALRTDLALDRGELVASVSWYATGTRRGGVLPAVEAGPMRVDGVIDEPIDGELRLRVVLTTRDATSEDPQAPVEEGTIVWERAERFYLSGGRARFPMLAVPFRGAGLGPNTALWKVLADMSDLEADPSVALQLIVNEEHPRADELLRAERSDLVSVLQWDIRRHVIELLLDDDDVEQLPDVPSGTVGSFARQCLNLALGHQDLAAARTLRRNDRARFETLVRGATLSLPG